MYVNMIGGEVGKPAWSEGEQRGVFGCSEYTQLAALLPFHVSASSVSRGVGAYLDYLSLKGD